MAICANCGDEFIPKRKWQIFCSPPEKPKDQCRNEFWKKKFIEWREDAKHK